jgi:hypothetical protein
MPDGFRGVHGRIPLPSAVASRLRHPTGGRADSGHGWALFQGDQNAWPDDSLGEENVPNFLLAPWHVDEDDQEDPDADNAPGTLSTVRRPLRSASRISHEIVALARGLLEERRLSGWGVEVEFLCVPKYGSSGEPPTRRLREGEAFVRCRYDDKKIILGVHPDLEWPDYEKGIYHQLGNILTGAWAKKLGGRLLREYRLRGWKFIVTRDLGENAQGACRPVEKEIYLDP